MWRRKDKLLIVAASVVEGARCDEHGVWLGLGTLDFEACCRVVGWLAPSEELGAALREALLSSRLNVPRPPAWANGVGSDKAETDARLAAEFGLANARRLYQGMLSPGADWALGVVTLYPSRRRHGGQFEAFQPPWADQHPPVSLPFSSSDAELGRAIRTCVGRCA